MRAPSFRGSLGFLQPPLSTEGGFLLPSSKIPDERMNNGKRQSKNVRTSYHDRIF